MPRLLTRRKTAWADRRKPQVIRGGTLNNPSIIEERYAQRLESLVARMADEVESSLKKFFLEPLSAEFFAEDASISSQARILTNELMRRFNRLFSTTAPSIAEHYTGSINKASSANVHGSLKELSGGLSLPTTGITSDMSEVLGASIAEQVSLIKSISMEYLSGVQGAVMRSITTGNGLSDLVPFLNKHKGITERRAKMIAHDQTRKAYNNLNKGRMEKLGLTKFIWLHTGGSSHPRPLHVSYSGKIFSFDDPPIIDEKTGERGIPGQAINCRCRMQPVLDFGDE
jgi:SPP1 gp7 family putative phage head morphogenesis protein